MVLDRLKRRVPAKFNTYIEPFAGSACLFFALCPSSAILADLNSDLINSYKTICRNPIRVLRRAKATPVTSSEYYKIRSLRPENLSSVDAASRFLYLNRYCFNALYRTNKSGAFNVPIGRNTGNFPEEADFRKAAKLLSQAKLLCCDFTETLSRARKGDFVYLDPPYVRRKGTDKNVYGSGSFSEADLPRLIAALHALHIREVRFLLSYSKCPQLAQVLPSKAQKSFKVRRQISGSAGFRGYVQEVLLDNRDIFGTFPDERT